MGLKSALSKAAGLFVEIPEESQYVSQYTSPVAPSTPAPKPAPGPAARTVADVVKAAPGPNLDQIKTPPETAKAPPLRPDGTPDFKAIFEQSGVPTVAFGSEEALQVIASLPADLPLEVKRATVGATLSAMGKAMGVTTDSVVADASRKVAALASFSDQLTAQTHQYQGLIEQQIADLKAKISDCEGKLAESSEKLATAVKMCEDEAAHLDDVLEFFTLDHAPSKHA